MLDETQTGGPVSLGQEADGEGKTEAPAEGKAEPADDMLERARESIDAIGMMVDNLRVLLSVKK